MSTVYTNYKKVGEEQDIVLDIIKETLPKGERHEKYRNIQYMNNGGTKNIYEGTWGPGKEEVAIKVEKTPESPHAIRNVKRGCTIERELELVSRIKNPEDHNIVRLRDWHYSEKLKQMGYSGYILVEDKVNGKNLEEVIEERPLSIQEFKQIFKDVLEAQRYLIKDCGLYHRDLSKKNILVQKNGKLRAFVTDTANACDVDSVKPKPLPTTGSLTCLDPTNFEVYMGKESKYREESEIHATSKNMLSTLIGSNLIKYSPEKGIAINNLTGESLINSQGLLDIEKHDKVMEQALKKIPKSAKKYVPMLRKGLSLNEDKRYHNLDDFVKDFKSANKPTLWEKIKKHPVVIGAIATGIIGFGTLFGLAYNHKNEEAKNLAAEVTKRDRVPVEEKWSGEPLEIANNIVKLKVNLYERGDYDNTLHVVEGEDKPYLKADAGDEFLGTVITQQKAIKSWGKRDPYPPNLIGKAYFEGFSGEGMDDFSVHAYPFDQTSMYGEMHGYYGGSINLKVPENIPDGNYTLAVEIIAPENDPDSVEYGNRRAFLFKNPGKIMNRIRIPVVVGNPEKKVDIDYARLDGINERIVFSDLDEKGKYYNISPRGVAYEFSIPEHDTTWTKDGYYVGLPPPKEEDFGKEKIRTLQLIYKNKKDGKYLGHTFIPIKAEKWCDDCQPHWIYGTPDSTWSNQLVAYGQAIFGDSTGLKRLRENMRDLKKKAMDEKTIKDSLRADKMSMMKKLASH